MPTNYDYDLVVIGSGPAGEKGAAQAAYFGKRVALVERAQHLGGAGINTGTVPSKTLRETALYFSGLRQRGLYGIDYSLKEGLTVGDLMYRERIVVENEWGLIEGNLERHGIEVIRGEAALKDAHTVRVRLRDSAERYLTTETILLATGSAPHHPAEIPFDHRVICDSDSILRMSRIPRTLAIVGGGVIGSEYASIFAALGVQVTLVDSRHRLLPFVEAEIADRLKKQLEGIGVRFSFNDRALKIEVAQDRARITLQGGEALQCEIALFAAGRQSNVQGLGLEELGVELGIRGLVRVNEKYQTRVPNIYAAGDVIGFPALASTSMEQARVAMVHAFDLKYKERVSPVLPLAIYTIPEISLVGLTEEACKEKNLTYVVGRSYYEKSARGQIIGDLSGMLKLIFSPADKKLLGVHHIGELASELVHIGAQVMAADGTIDAFIHAVYNYPTLADSYKYAAYDGLGNLQKWQQSEPVPQAETSAATAKTQKRGGQ
jgi:NAD(P) transhydrogenase